jgi:hypothetical protein
LAAQFGLPNHLADAPTFVLRVYHYFKAKNPPKATLLNSFFLGDLARGTAIVGKNGGPIGLRRYLGTHTVRREDIGRREGVLLSL